MLRHNSKTGNKIASKNFGTRNGIFEENKNKNKNKRILKPKTLAMIPALMFLFLHWLILSPCNYKYTCLSHACMAYSNISHKLAMLYNLVQIKHPHHVALPWFVLSTFEQDLLFWNSLSSCGLSFKRSRFKVDHSDLVDYYDLEKNGYKRSFLFHECIPGKMENIVYVGRGSSLRRRMRDEIGFVEALKKYTGYDIRYVSNMASLTLFDQAQTFKNAKAVISMHGAQLSFSLFSEPESTIIELVPCNNEYCVPYVHRNHSSSTNWYYVEGHGTKSEKSIRYPRDMVMDWDWNTLDKIKNVLSGVV